MITTNAIDDASVVADLLSDIGHSIKSFTGDGAYDKVKVRKALPVGVKQIIPPQHNAVKSKGDKRYLRSRDQVLKAIGKLGRKQWKINVGYHKRILAEKQPCSNIKQSSELISNPEILKINGLKLDLAAAL